MKRTVALLIAAICLFSFKPGDHIAACYLSFAGTGALTAQTPDRLPEAAEKSRTVKTNDGTVTVSRTDGYRILYHNEHGAPFVNLKVELSEAAEYATDQQHLLDNLRYLIVHSKGMESSDLIQLNKNGYSIYGLSRSDIDSGSILGTFLMFPGDNTVVYFYFNNLKPEYRNFSSVADYKRQRDDFLDQYTRHLQHCR